MAIFSSADARRAVERGFGETVGFLAELVRVPSLLGEEEPAQALVEARLRALGFEVESVIPDPAQLAERPDSGIPLMPYGGRRSLVATIGAGTGPSLVLNGHVDVVSAEPLERWTKEPFGAEIADGRMYGRGAVDMKGGIAAMLLGVQAALAAGPLPGQVVYQSVIEEECGGNGALAAVLAGPGADAALIAEPTNGGMDLVAVGVIWARITLSADARHASNADRGSNPIEAAFPVIDALHRLEAELNADPDPELEGLEQPYLLNVGALHAGDWASMTPGEAVLDVRLGFPIRMEPAEAQSRLAAAVHAADPAVGVEFRGFRARGYAFHPDSPFVRLLGDCHEEIRGGRPVPEPSRATTDLRFFEGQAVCYGPTGENLHGVDEWVDLESLADVAAVTALLIRRWMD
ncbi:MAG TPA: ArgE/DapE family deacylase [Gaiellaceae bacterium]|jgi:acetylornithine deacetylase|nr:ArgE/DapE family deacylase [Gaiellaceae bacterium]